jgi:hypothetical protein
MNYINENREYYPTLIKCSDCNREFVFTMHGSIFDSSSEVNFCYTCYGTKFGIDALKTKQITSFIDKYDENSGLLMLFLWEVPFQDWSDDIKSRFITPPKNDD